MGKHIHTAVVVEQSSTSIQVIRGKFWPRDRQIGREEDLASYETKVIYTEALDTLLRNSGVIREARASNGLLGSLLVSILPILLLVTLFYFLFNRQIRSAKSMPATRS